MFSLNWLETKAAGNSKEYASGRSSKALAANLTRARLAAYFLTSFIVGVLGAGFVGSWLNAASSYEKPLDALGAVILSALCIKILTFLNNQDLNSLFSFFSRLRGGGGNGR